MMGEEEKGKDGTIPTKVVELSSGETIKKKEKKKKEKKSKSKKRKEEKRNEDGTTKEKSKKKSKKQKINDDDDHHEEKEKDNFVVNQSSDVDKPSKSIQDGDDGDDNNNRNKEDEEKIQASLKKAYQDALQAYKADKTNKDLRRAKSIAKKAWDDRVIAAAGPDAIPLQCRNCSQLFIFCDSDKFKAKGWGDTRPTQCKACTYNIDMKRGTDDKRKKIDERQNMCYEYQKTGKCSRGDRCKFSHAKSHIGKKKQAIMDARPICYSIAKGETCPHGDQCRFRHTTTPTTLPTTTTTND